MTNRTTREILVNEAFAAGFELGDGDRASGNAERTTAEIVDAITLPYTFSDAMVQGYLDGLAGDTWRLKGPGLF